MSAFTRFAACLFLFVATPALAADPSGVWAFHAGDKAMFLFEVSRTAAGWTGVWSKPENFESDGDSYVAKGPVFRLKASSARAVGDAIELTFNDARPGQSSATFSFRLLDPTHAEARVIGVPVAPLSLLRQPRGAPFGGWDPTRPYMRIEQWPDNAEMTAMFEADQKPRENWNDLTQADRSALTVADRQRRARTQALLDAGELRSALDFFHAAFLFQHGDVPADYLKAHILATISVARGKPGAKWIAAATLDRYLQSIGQPQILGTQFSVKDGSADQQPYDRTLISDPLRQALGVPTLGEQVEQGKGMASKAARAK